MDGGGSLLVPSRRMERGQRIMRRGRLYLRSPRSANRLPFPLSFLFTFLSSRRHLPSWPTCSDRESRLNRSLLFYSGERLVERVEQIHLRVDVFERGTVKIVGQYEESIRSFGRRTRIRSGLE